MFEIAKTNSTPYILVDEERGYMHFRGESFHENVPEFYRNIMEWLHAFLHGDFECFTFDCELKYFNSSTAKLLLNMLTLMDNAASSAHPVTVNWITTQDNEINIECGEDFAEEVNNLTFNIVIQ